MRVANGNPKMSLLPCEAEDDQFVSASGERGPLVSTSLATVVQLVNCGQGQKSPGQVTSDHILMG